MTPDQCFPPSLRLRRAAEFQAAFAVGRQPTKDRGAAGVFRGTWLRCYWRENGGAQARLGLVVGKRNAARAVDRNRVKRCLREIFRRQRATLPAIDIVFQLSARYGPGSDVSITAEAATQLRRILARATKLS